MNMNTPQRYKLIDGEFAPDRAMHVLLSLVNNKIDFHNVEKLSNEERFGKDVTHSQHRLTELKQLRDTLRELCGSLSESGTRVRINGWIEIESVAEQSAAEPKREPQAVH